eukprot:755562-Hanusia_phi.AAC.2
MLSLINYFQLKRLSYTMAYHHAMRTIVRSLLLLPLHCSKCEPGLASRTGSSSAPSRSSRGSLLPGSTRATTTISSSRRSRCAVTTRAIQSKEDGSKSPRSANVRRNTFTSPSSFNSPSSAQADPARMSKRKLTT